MRRTRNAFATLILLLATATVAWSQQAISPRISPAMRDRAARDGSVPLILELRLPRAFRAEGGIPQAADVRTQREQIDGRASRVLAALPRSSYRIRHAYTTVPYVAVELTPAGLDALEKSDVVRIFQDEIVYPVLGQSVP